MKNKILFIADFFRDDLLGGAESNDSVLVSFLENNFEVEKKHCRAIDLKYLVELDRHTKIIISNFVSLAEESKNYIKDNFSYIIYEHDHKYVSTRDPSKFINFKIPKEKIVNRQFYENAQCVVVLTKICKQILEDSLSLTNVKSIGTSLWEENKLSKIEKMCENEKTFNYAIVNSQNPIKGTKKSLEWCANNNITPELIESSNEEQFLEMLSKCDKLVFVPQVLETFSRLSAEAKMLNCKLITNKNLLGFASEESYGLSGKELIEETRKRVQDALNLFLSLCKKEDSENDITVILNCYRRPHLLNEQLDSIKNQTVKPKEIIVWINDSEESRNLEIAEKNIKIIKCNHNWKFFGRFSAALLARTKYIAMYDDDTIPGKEWHKNCLETIKTNRGILGGVGCILNGQIYQGHKRVGWSNPNQEVEQVDLVGHAWFFEREWLKYFWMEDPFTWENGEDIHFSYTSQKYGNIKTYVPPHKKEKPETFSSLKGMEYGVDDVATSVSRNHSVFYSQRDGCVKHCSTNGWKLVKEK